MKRLPCVLGIDAGTESVRAVLFDAQGRARGSGCMGYATHFVRPAWVEQEPQEVWEALLTALRCAVAAVPQAEIVGCCLASTAVTVVTVDEDGAAFCPAILWMDTRASEEAAEINASGHPALWYTGNAVSPEWMLPKALWLKRHEPERYRRARYLVELHDWLMFRLTGSWALSLATISGEWSYVRERGGWPLDLLEALDLADLPCKWPITLLQAGQLAGFLRREVAAAVGLASGLPVAQGLMDSYAASIAANVFAPGRMSLSLGSSSSYLGLVQTPVSDRRLLGPVPDAFGSGTWAMQGGQTSAASLLRWFREQLAPGVSYAILDNEAAALPPGSEGLRALDTWQGSRTPHRDPAGRGGFWGLNLGHTRAHLYRALLESVAYGGRQIVEAMQQAGVEVGQIVACGGGSRSPVWMQMHADILQRPVTVLDEPLAAALGAAMCAAVAAGWHDHIRAAAAALTRSGRTFLPQPEYWQVYQEGYMHYLSGYAAHQRLQESSGEQQP
jgi:ribulose kinase